MTVDVAPHPARWSEAVLDAIGANAFELLADHVRILDPFAGVGRHRLATHLGEHDVVGVELEPEWCPPGDGQVRADALRLPFPDSAFDALATSPCLAQHERILTDDLRWVPAGDLRVGDRLLAFDEHGGHPHGGRAARRRWQRAEVVRSEALSVECVRVILANGDEVITTPNHPWLASRYAYGGTNAEWVPSAALMGSLGVGTGRGHLRGARQPYYVHLQVRPWVARRSYDAGWLAGMFDGEGSLSLGVHGSPKMQLCQVEGPVVDHVERLMEAFGYNPNRITRKSTPAGRQPMVNLYVTDGFPGMLRALGELRPRRLLAKWETLDVSTRTVQAEKVAVVAVEPAGRVDIQGIETTSGTYIGEGYLHHNTYGNRMADSHDARDACKTCNGTGVWPAYPASGTKCRACGGRGLSKRNTYTHTLGRKPSPGSSTTMQWGKDYRAFHEAAWRECDRVLRPESFVFLNVSNHIRDGREQHVAEWHLNAWMMLGARIHHVERIPTPRQKFGQNGDARVDGELLVVLQTRPA